MSARLVQTYPCQWCGEKFHPLPGSYRKYCSPACSGKARTAAAERRRRDHVATLTREQWDAFLAEATQALAEYEAELRQKEAAP